MIRSDVREMTNEDILKEFRLQNVPLKIRCILLPFCNIAHTMDKELPDCVEKTAGLQKLLEAKNLLISAANTEEENQHA